MILYAGVPVAARARVVPLDLVERGRASRVTTPAEVGEVEPIGVAIREDEVAAAEMSRHRVVQTIRLRELVFWLLAKENRDGWTCRPVAPESDMGASFLVPAYTHRVHEIGVV